MVSSLSDIARSNVILPAPMVVPSSQGFGVVHRHGQISPVSSSSTSPRLRMKKVSEVNAVVETTSSLHSKEPLPSLCELIEEPEPHPDFHLIMASLRERKGVVMPLRRHSTPLKINEGRNALPEYGLRQQAKETDREPIASSNYIGFLRNKGQAGTIHLPSLPLLFPNKFSSTSVLKSLSPLSNSRSPSLSQGEETISTPTRKVSHFELSPPGPATVFATSHYNVTIARYVTNADPRGSLPVYQYQILEHTIMIDMETSYVLLTSICNALGPTRANIITLIESSVELQPYVRKVQGGFLKIQGLWVPFSMARELARRVAWMIRFDLVPLFGYQFPTQCLSPNDPGFGDLRLMMGVRRSKRPLMPEQYPQSQQTNNKRSSGTAKLDSTSTPTNAADNRHQMKVFGNDPHLAKRPRFESQPVSSVHLHSMVQPTRQESDDSHSTLEPAFWPTVTENQQSRMREEGEVNDDATSDR